MITNISFAKKIISIVFIAFIAFVSIIYLTIYENYKDTLLKEEIEKIDILLEMIAPAVEIDLEFDTKDNIVILFNQLLKSNRNVVDIRLYNLNGKIIMQKHSSYSKNNVIIRKKMIKDKITKNNIAYLQIYYLTTNYTQAINKFKNMFIWLSIALVLFLIIFIFLNRK